MAKKSTKTTLPITVLTVCISRIAKDDLDRLSKPRTCINTRVSQEPMIAPRGLVTPNGVFVGTNAEQKREGEAEASPSDVFILVTPRFVIILLKFSSTLILVTLLPTGSVGSMLGLLVCLTCSMVHVRTTAAGC